MTLPPTITFITGNANKLAEVTAILADPSIGSVGVDTSADNNFSTGSVNTGSVNAGADNNVGAGESQLKLPQIVSMAADLPELQGSIDDISRMKCERAAELVRPCSVLLFATHLY